eukprot:6418636-Amphidinium_carterae.1
MSKVPSHAQTLDNHLRPFHPLTEPKREGKLEPWLLLKLFPEANDFPVCDPFPCWIETDIFSCNRDHVT